MSLFKDSLKQGVSPAHLKEDLIALSKLYCGPRACCPAHLLGLVLRAGLPEAHADAVSSLWRSQLVDLSRAAINASLQVNQLVDMDWKFGVTVASDELDQVRTCSLRCWCASFLNFVRAALTWLLFCVLPAWSYFSATEAGD